MAESAIPRYFGGGAVSSGASSARFVGKYGVAYLDRPALLGHVGRTGAAPNPLMTWGTLVTGVLTVVVAMTDPVSRLSDDVRVNGPIIHSVEAPADAIAPTPLPSELLTRRVPLQQEMAQAPDVTVATDPPPGVQQDAHLLEYLAATAVQREAALRLDRAKRLAVQRRLALMGYDPRGIDGVLGPQSRAAILAWQRNFGFVETGYLDEAVIASIEERSVEVWAEWRAAEARRTRHAALRPAAAPDSSEPPAEREECVRGDDGRILESQSFGCDLKGVKEGFQRLFAKMGDGSGGSADLPAPGADR